MDEVQKLDMAGYTTTIMTISTDNSLYIYSIYFTVSIWILEVSQGYTIHQIWSQVKYNTEIRPALSGCKQESCMMILLIGLQHRLYLSGHWKSMILHFHKLSLFPKFLSTHRWCDVMVDKKQNNCFDRRGRALLGSGTKLYIKDLK